MNRFFFALLCGIALNLPANAQSITDMHPESEVLPILLSARKPAVEWGETQQKPQSWTVLQFSDIHGSLTQLERVVAFKNAYSAYVDDAIHTGDAVACYYDDPNPWFYVEGAEQIMNTIGNHDCWKGHLVWAQSDTPYDATQEDAYRQFIGPFAGHWEVRQPEGVDDPRSAHFRACYYFKDYPVAGIRMIVLDCMHYGKTQDQWFREVLSEAREKDLHVVAVQHYPAQGGLDLIECGFTELYETIGPESTPPEGKQMERMPDAAFDTVDAFLNQGGSFICWLSGHTHLDFIGHVHGHVRQLQVIVDKAGEVDDYMQEDRTPGTRNQDSFNLVTVNPSRNLLVIQRIGCTHDQYLRSKRLFSYDYVMRKILACE